MRVSIEHQEKAKGFLGHHHQVDVITSVEFSEEEISIIKNRQLENHIVIEREPDSRTAGKMTAEELEACASNFHLRVGHLMQNRSDRFTFDSPSQAKAYQQRLAQALQELKSFLNNNAAIGLPTTFEI